MTVTVTTDGPSGAAIDTRLTLLTLVTNMCREVGLPDPLKIVGSNDQTAKELQHFMQEACEEVARRVDWGTLRATQDFTGTGTNASFDVPLDFTRLIQGTAVYANGQIVRGGLTADEWQTLPSSTGQPRYYHLRGETFQFWPYLPSGETATIHYQSKHYTLAGYDYFRADDDLLLIPHQVASKGLVWRWRRHVGQPFEDYLAEFEGILQQYADFDIKDRTP